jgi:hypothetical protein
VTTSQMTQAGKEFRIELLRDLIRLMRNRDTDGQSSHAIDAMEIVAQLLEELVVPQMARDTFERVIASLNYDGRDADSLTVGEIRRALP